VLRLSACTFGLIYPVRMISAELVADDRVARLILVDRRRNTTTVGGIGTRIQSVRELDAIDAVGHHAFPEAKVQPCSAINHV